MKYQEFIQELKRGKIAPLYFFTGAEEFLKREAVHSLYRLLVQPEQKDFNYVHLYGKDSSAGEILDQAQALPFMAAKRLVVVQEFEKLTGKDKLLPYVSNPNPSTCLVLVMGGGEKKSASSIFKELGCYEVICYPLFESELRKWIQERFNHEKKQIDSGVFELIVENAGTDLGLISSEIEKILLIYPEKARFSEKDVRDVLFRRAENKTSKLEKHILAKNMDRILLALKDLLGEGIDPAYLLGVIANTVRKLMRAKEMSAKNLSEEEIAAAQRLRTYSDKKIFFSYLERATLDELMDVHKKITEADILIKTGRRNPAEVVELVLARLGR